MTSIPGNDFSGWKKTLSKLSPFAIHKVLMGVKLPLNGDIYLTSI